MKPVLLSAIAAAAFFCCLSCSGSLDPNGNKINKDTESITKSTLESPLDGTIASYSGAKATDISSDKVDNDNEDIYWDASGNNFSNKVTVTFNGESATIETSYNKVDYSHTVGADVVLDFLTPGGKNAEVVLKGTSTDGSVKIYGEKKFKLTLDGLELTSTKGPAINSQCKKRVFVHLAEGTTNVVADASSYSDDVWYIDETTKADEDRKAAIFTEGNQIFSGSGILKVKGNKKHAICSDGYIWIRPGVTIVVESAAKDAIHCNGDDEDADADGNLLGFYMDGGYIYAKIASTAGKCINTDQNIRINGGTLELNTTGDAEYDDEEKDTTAPSCMKADCSVLICGGDLTLKSSGKGGKCINADIDINISGGTIKATTTGAQFLYGNIDSDPKGIKADGNINISGGSVTVAVTGKNEGAEGIESKDEITISGGEVYSYAYDDAMNAANCITIDGGKTFCYSLNNDGIDSNGDIYINGGYVFSVGSDREAAIDNDNPGAKSTLQINGGIVAGIGGAVYSPSSCKQNTLIYNGISANKGKLVSILDSNSSPVFTIEFPCGASSQGMIVSTPKLVNGSYTIEKNGTLSSYGDKYLFYYDGGKWSGGTSLASFTVSSSITNVGTSSGMGGGGGFGPGGMGR